MEFKDCFNELKKDFINKDVSNVPNVVFEFNIKDIGVFYAKVQDGKLDIQPYNYYDNDVSFTAKFEIYKKIINGELDPIKSFFTGRLKVSGDLGKAALLQSILK